MQTQVIFESQLAASVRSFDDPRDFIVAPVFHHFLSILNILLISNALTTSTIPLSYEYSSPPFRTSFYRHEWVITSRTSLSLQPCCHRYLLWNVKEHRGL